MIIRVKKNNESKIDTGTVYVNDFGDNYHRSDLDPDDDLTREALNIRRIYKKQGDYHKAKSILFEYIEALIEKYDGPMKFRIALEAGLVDDYIPPIPKLKNKRYDKFYKKNILVSEVSIKKTDTDEMLEFIRSMDEGSEVVLAGIGEHMKRDKGIEKAISAANMTSNNQVNANSRDISILQNYLMRRDQEDKEESMKTAEGITLTELLSDEFYEILDRLNGNGEDDLISYNGKLIERSRLQDLENIKELHALGWNTTKIMNIMFSSSDTILKITQEERKSAKRAAKSLKKAEGYMSKLMTDGKYGSFDEFDKAISSSVNESIFDRFKD